ncbi:peptidase-C39 like family protein [Fulvivirga sp. 29W222]|uniref:Peptidase-C39 like family protein n=1 Tax=Fulvivirga marina TaxID=2494733 RepID=A0A937KE91_9BACT|nr:peptidase-C39 like family protein [Fulvivirga marina]MBL6446973.1 peptidase-C39 like family protein [Fulvivirga marina]
MLLKTKEKILDLNIKAQPDDVTCGPTCLHGVYQYYDDNVSLRQVIDEVKQLASGGTIAVLLGNHALKRGYNATIYTYNLGTFDPSWFKKRVDLTDKLKEQVKAKPEDEKLQVATAGYLQFLSNGGTIKFEELTPNLIKYFLTKKIPILTGLSSTYLYESPRETGEFIIGTGEYVIRYDDVNGAPTGHFVIINGFNQEKRLAFIADPLDPNPISEKQYYKVSFHKLINSIMLGVMTYDANLLIIYPKKYA